MKEISEGTKIYDINFSENDIRVIYSTLLESFSGYAGDFFPGFLNTNKNKLEELFEIVKAKKEEGKYVLSFSGNEWRLIYEAINAVIYELGPEDLQIHTGNEIYAFLNTSRIIYTKIYDRKNLRFWKD